MVSLYKVIKGRLHECTRPQRVILFSFPFWTFRPPFSLPALKKHNIKKQQHQHDFEAMTCKISLWIFSS